MCNKCNGVSLHNHSEVSSDGICFPSEFIDRAIQLNQNSLAFTEHYEHSTIVEASSYAESLKGDFKVIAGVETYVDINEDFDNTNRTHLTILGNGLKGYNNIVRIQKTGSLRTVRNTTNKNHFNRPSVYVGDIFKYSDNLIVLSGCPSSVFNDRRKFDDNQADEFYRDFKNKFGDRFYVEITLSSEDIGGYTLMDRIRRSLYFASKHNLRIVITDDAHFATKDQAPAQDFYKRKVRGLDYDGSELYLKGAVEQITIINNLPMWQSEKEWLIEGVMEQQKIADRLDSVSFNTGLIMPEIENGDVKFNELVYAEYERHIVLEESDAEYLEISKARLDEEMRVIKLMGFQTYFLKVNEMNEFIASVGGKLPYGRGSAGGSFVCFLMGIVKLNPITYGLYFERMLNVQRKSPIDIDLDYTGKYRQMLIDHMAQTEGAVGIVTQMRYGHNSLIDDIAGSPRYNLLGHEVKALKANEAGFKSSATWKGLLENHPELDGIYDNLIGRIRNASRHAGGLVIEPTKSEYEMPVTVTKNGDILCSLIEGGHGQMASRIGINKYDLLGNDGLTFLDKLEKATGVEAPVFALNEYHEGFKALETGKTDGIFQLSGTATSDYAKQHGVRNFEDIISITSLARKGVVLSGTDQEILNHRPIKGLPKRRSNGVHESGNLILITMEDGTSFKVYENWEIKTDSGWIQIKELSEEHELEIE